MLSLISGGERLFSQPAKSSSSDAHAVSGVGFLLRPASEVADGLGNDHGVLTGVGARRGKYRAIFHPTGELISVNSSVGLSEIGVRRAIGVRQGYNNAR